MGLLLGGLGVGHGVCGWLVGFGFGFGFGLGLGFLKGEGNECVCVIRSQDG